MPHPIAILMASATLASDGRPPILDLYTHRPYEAKVPKVEATLGYELGSRISTYHEQDRVIRSIADASKDRVREFAYGKSAQGRRLRVFAISAPKHMKRLEEIRKAHQSIANGVDPGLTDLPAIVWINQCIHGNEPASFESGMALFYNLAASRHPRIEKMLENTVVMFNPVYNPDGHERFAVFYNSIARNQGAPGSYELQEPSVVHGRTNHYRFDMNRDRVAFSQDETRQEFAEFLRWRPQIYTDQHGQVSTYFFPPESQSINANVDRARNNKWTEIIGRHTGKKFDELGFQYFIKETFDFYFPGYLDVSTGLSGAIGMTHETDGGKYLAQNRADGSVLTFRRGVEKHFVSALAVIEAGALNRQPLLQSCLEFKKKVVSGTMAGKFQRVVLTAPDPRPLLRLKKQLAFGGIVSRFSTEAFTQPDANDYWSNQRGSKQFPAGALVIDMNQSQGALAKALLEPGSDFEKEFIEAQLNKRKTAPEGENYPGPDESEFYDTTGWALPYAHNLAAWWCESRAAVKTSDDAPSYEIMPVEPSSVGYAIPYVDEDDARAVFHILADGVKGAITNKPMELAQGRFEAGTFLFLADRNEPGFERIIAKHIGRFGASAFALTSSYPEADRNGPGGYNVALLRAPKIGVIFGNGTDLAGVSGTWYTLERALELPFDSLSANALNRDLSQYTVLIVPPYANVSASERLKDWVRSGGTLITFESVGWALGSSGFVSLDRAKGDPQSLPGALFRAQLDRRSPLSYGYLPTSSGQLEIAVPLAGSGFYAARREGGSVLKFGDEKTKKLLSGWVWPDDTEKNIANTVWLQDAKYGQGHAFLFMQDPCERAMYPGLHKLLLNAILLGPAR
ncbi:MAG: M14 family metallopeptidase [Fimbriimonadaceae bacterium]|nr:M14 family metallopeptidase [Fimbriimonadaceae bacterium]